MQDELRSSVALPTSAATQTTDANTPIEITDSRPDNDAVAIITKPTNQTDATGAIGATGPPYDTSTRANDMLITSAHVREKLGNCSDMTIWRKLKHDPDFPRPRVIAGRRFWWQTDILAYIERQPIG